MDHSNDIARRNLVIIGDSAFAEIAYCYFSQSSKYSVVGFAVEQAFLKRDELFGLPVVPFESLKERFPPETSDVYVAIVYTQLNRLRTRLCLAAKELGYTLASYVSPNAFVGPNVHVGEHCFIFENNVVQPFVRIGDNVVLWSGNHIGHHSTIGDNVFVSSHVVISGFCEIGANTFLGVNSTLANNLQIGKDCWIGPGVLLSKNTKDGELYHTPAGEPAKISALRFFRVKE